MAAEIQKLFEGSWKYYKSENLEQYLDKLDIGAVKKKLANTVSPTLKVSVEGETISVSISAGIRTRSNSFTLGSTFDIEMEEMSGTGVSSFAGGVWTMQVTPKAPKKAKPQTVTRQIIDGELVQTMVVEEVTCKRYFKKS